MISKDLDYLAMTLDRLKRGAREYRAATLATVDFHNLLSDLADHPDLRRLVPTAPGMAEDLAKQIAVIRGSLIADEVYHELTESIKTAIARATGTYLDPLPLRCPHCHKEVPVA